jgi:hypothetical protein
MSIPPILVSQLALLDLVGPFVELSGGLPDQLRALDQGLVQ